MNKERGYVEYILGHHMPLMSVGSTRFGTGRSHLIVFPNPEEGMMPGCIVREDMTGQTTMTEILWGRQLFQQWDEEWERVASTGEPRFDVDFVITPLHGFPGWYEMGDIRCYGVGPLIHIAEHQMVDDTNTQLGRIWLLDPSKGDAYFLIG